MWTIPVIGNIARDQVDCLCSALAKVEALALKTLYEPWTPVKPAVAESSAGVTEFSNRDIRFNGPKAAALAKSRSREQEARWIEDYSRVIFG